MSTSNLRWLATNLDYLRVPLNSEERSERQGPFAYWGANGVVDYVDAFLINEPVVLIGEDGAPFFDRHKPVAFLSDEPIWPNNHIHVLKPDPKVLDARFCVYFLNSVDYSQYINGSTRDKLTQSQLGSIRVSYPDLATQKAIADFLDRETARIDQLIEKKHKLITLLSEAISASTTSAITRGLHRSVDKVGSSAGWMGEIPSHWDLKKLKFLGTAITGLTYSPNDVVPGEQGILVLRASNIYENKLLLQDTVHVNMDIPEKLRTREGDILICSRSGSRSLIGKNAMIGPSEAGLTFGAFMTVFRSNHNPYLKHVFDSKLFEYLTGSFQTSTINQLTLSTLNNMQVPVPPEREQMEISQYLDAANGERERLRKMTFESILRLQEFRASLITAAVTGQLDISTWNKRGETARQLEAVEAAV